MAKIKNLFVAWIGEFEHDIAEYGLSISNISHECGGYDVELSGPLDKLTEFLTNNYLPGMEAEDAVELMQSIEGAE